MQISRPHTLTHLLHTLVLAAVRLFSLGKNTQSENTRVISARSLFSSKTAAFQA